jgi:hypothetical protein
MRRLKRPGSDAAAASSAVPVGVRCLDRVDEPDGRRVMTAAAATSSTTAAVAAAAAGSAAEGAPLLLLDARLLVREVSELAEDALDSRPFAASAVAASASTGAPSAAALVSGEMGDGLVRAAGDAVDVFDALLPVGDDVLTASRSSFTIRFGDAPSGSTANDRG